MELYRKLLTQVQARIKKASWGVLVCIVFQAKIAVELGIKTAGELPVRTPFISRVRTDPKTSRPSVLNRLI